jgi:hypothetical protein
LLNTKRKNSGKFRRTSKYVSGIWGEYEHSEKVSKETVDYRELRLGIVS